MTGVEWTAGEDDSQVFASSSVVSYILENFGSGWEF